MGEGNEWSYATTLHEMFDETAMKFLEKTGIISYLPDYSMNLFIPKAATEEELERFETDLKYVMTYVRYSDDKNKLMNYARENNIVLNIESVTIINALTNSNLKIEEGKDEIHMCKALDDLIEDGRNEGRSEGVEIGRQEGIAALISICREFGVGDKEIINRLMEKFSLSKEEATDKVIV
jgi:SHS2 domain-containing protein